MSHYTGREWQEQGSQAQLCTQCARPGLGAEWRRGSPALPLLLKPLTLVQGCVQLQGSLTLLLGMLYMGEQQCHLEQSHFILPLLLAKLKTAQCKNLGVRRWGFARSRLTSKAQPAHNYLSFRVSCPLNS